MGAWEDNGLHELTFRTVIPYDTITYVVDFTYVPEAIGADVVVDGEPLDTLKMLRRQLINGIRVSNGEHTVDNRFVCTYSLRRR